MSHANLLRGGSACAIACLLACSASAQEALPTIDVGVAHPATSSGRAAPGGPDDPKAYSRPNSSAATRTDTPIMKTPADVVVIPQQVLQDQQVVRIEDAVQNVSGVVPISVSGLQAGFLFRGFANFSYFLDGARLQNQTTPMEEEVADIDQIEVLKGPASIMFGRLEPGGMFALTTKQPLDTPYYSINQQFGSFRYYRTTVDATGPLTDDKSLAYRFNFAYKNAHSFRDYVESRDVFLAPKIRWAPTDDTVFNAYLRYTNGVGPLAFPIPSLTDAKTGAFLGLAPVPFSRNYAGPGSQTNNYDVRVGYNWTHKFDADWSVTQRFDANFLHAIGNAVVPLSVALPCDPCVVRRAMNNPNTRVETYFISAELRGKFETLGVGHSILAGWDFFRDAGHTSRSFAVTSAVPRVDLFAPVVSDLPLWTLVNPARHYTIDRAIGWHGFYFQDQMSLPYDVHLMAGVRYDTSDIFSSQTFDIPSYSVNHKSTHDSAVTPRVGLLWQPIPQLSLFGDYVEGFGPATLLNADSSPNPNLLAPQRSNQWEAGVKISLFDGRLNATAAWFDISKTNIPTPHPDPNRAALGELVSTGEVRNNGVDFDISGQLTPELKLIGNFAEVESRVISDNVTSNIGKFFPGVPRFTGGLWGVYEPDIDMLRGFSFGAGFTSRSSVYYDSANTYAFSGFTTAKLMARYSFLYEGSKISFQLNVDNLTDAKYVSAGGGAIYLGAPRTLLGSVKVEF